LEIKFEPKFPKVTLDWTHMSPTAKNSTTPSTNLSWKWNIPQHLGTCLPKAPTCLNLAPTPLVW